jgi:epoxyqueuosine reductase
MILEDILQIPEASRKSQFFSAAQRAGFTLAGVAAALPSPQYLPYDQWVNDGMAGAMSYLADYRRQLRSDPRLLLPSARSILCLGRLYNTAGPPHPTISRYAWGAADYHDVLRRSIMPLIDDLCTVWGTFEYKICIDTAPLLERAYAHQAGLGWIGRNTCLINQPQGSWFFLAEVLVNIELEPDSPPPDRCGSCRRCIDACPTQALVPSTDGRYQLDARLCISNWTIEQRGPLPEAHQAASGPHLFGCDICQEVCPWNRRAPVTAEPEFQPIHAEPDLAEWAELTAEEFRARFRRTPLWRAKYQGLLRNVATAMGNSGDRRYLPALQQLVDNQDPAVSLHARAAIARLEAAP